MISRVLGPLFGPAAALIGRLRYAQKFVVVGLVLLIPLGFVATAYVRLQRDHHHGRHGGGRGNTSRYPRARRPPCHRRLRNGLLLDHPEAALGGPGDVREQAVDAAAGVVVEERGVEVW